MAPDEGFGLEGTQKPKIQRDPFPQKGNLICGTPLYSCLRHSETSTPPKNLRKPTRIDPGKLLSNTRGMDHKPRAGRRADFEVFPTRIRPKSGPEARFPAQKHYCVTSGTHLLSQPPIMEPSTRVPLKFIGKPAKIQPLRRYGTYSIEN